VQDEEEYDQMQGRWHGANAMLDHVDESSKKSRQEVFLSRDEVHNI